MISLAHARNGLNYYYFIVIKLQMPLLFKIIIKIISMAKASI